jgi:hypothetical protein
VIVFRYRASFYAKLVFDPTIDAGGLRVAAEHCDDGCDVLGIDPELLKNQGYIEYQLAMDIEEREVSFGTKDEEYNGRHDVKVVGIGKRSDPNLSRSAAFME